MTVRGLVPRGKFRALLARVDMIAPLEVMVVIIRNVLEDTGSPPYQRWLLLAALLASLPAVAWPQTQLATDRDDHRVRKPHGRGGPERPETPAPGHNTPRS